MRLPLGSTELLRPAAMANLLGDLWENRARRASRIGSRLARSREVKLHLYGKLEPQAGPENGAPHGARPGSGAAEALRGGAAGAGSLGAAQDLRLKD